MRKKDATVKASAKSEKSAVKTPGKKEVRFSKLLLNLTLRVGIVVAVLFVVFGMVFGLSRMRTALMMPSLHEGDVLLYYRLDRNFQLGDVVALKRGDKTYALRIVALGGQTVEVTDDGEVLVDGYPEATETYYPAEKIEAVSYPYKVPEDEVFLMGDYRMAVDDSRRWGAIPEEELKGKVIGRFQVRNI